MSCTCKRCTICGGTGELAILERASRDDAFAKEPCDDCDAGIAEECDYCQEQRDLQQDPGPVPNAAKAMLSGDVLGLRAWLAHPYIGDGGQMNAAAVWFSDRLVASEERVTFYEGHTAKQANEIVALSEENRVLLAALKSAVETIKVWHSIHDPDDNAWDIYRHAAPEMRPLFAAIHKAEGR